MKIISMTIKHVTASPFGDLVETPPPFTPYYTCHIKTDTGTYKGIGVSRIDAERGAIDNMHAAAANEIEKAISEYNSERGIHFIDC